jgi:hypothetical protein
VVLPTPWAAWKCSDGTGLTLADDVGSRPLVAGGPIDWVTGHDGETGGAAYLDPGESAVWDGSFGAGFSACTIECWYKPTNLGAGDTEVVAGLFAGGFGNSTRYAIWAQRGDFGTPNLLVGQFRGGGLDGIYDTAPLANDVWVHLALTWDGTTVRLYRNGAEVGNAAFGAGPWWSDASAFGVGGNADASRAVQDVRVYDVGLTGAQVIEAMNTPVGSSGGGGGTVQKTLPSNWSVRQAVVKTAAASWAVRQRTTKTVATSWAVRSQVLKAAAAAAWNVRSQVLKTAGAAWNVRLRVVKFRSSSWDVGSLAGTYTKLVTSTWAVRARVNKLIPSTWNTGSLAGTVTKLIASTWDVQARVLKTTPSIWAVRTTVTKTAAAAWAVRTLVQRAYPLAWSVRRSVVKTVPSTWSVRMTRVRTVVSRWNTLSDIVVVIEPPWTIRLRRRAQSDDAIRIWRSRR